MKDFLEVSTRSLSLSASDCFKGQPLPQIKPPFGLVFSPKFQKGNSLVEILKGCGNVYYHMNRTAPFHIKSNAS